MKKQLRSFPSGSHAKVCLTLALLANLLACQPQSGPSPSSASSASPALSATKPADLPDLSKVQSVLTQIKKLSNFDEEQIETILLQHNQQQAQIASDQQASPDWVLYDVGAQVLSLEQVGETGFTLLLRRVLEAHSAGVDTGNDQLTTLIFDKRSLRLLRAVEGKLENWQTDGLQIVAGKQESCLGVAVPDHFSVIDLKQGAKTLLTQVLEKQHDETALYRVEVKGPRQLDFITTSDQPYSGKASQAKSCDVGDWVDKNETTYTVQCNEQSVCTVSKQLKRYAGCQEIGSCD